MVSLGVGYRHPQTWCLQLPWPFRITLLMAAIEQQSGITTWMSERPRCDQMHEPFGQGCLQRPERLFGNDRLLEDLTRSLCKVGVKIKVSSHQLGSFYRISGLMLPSFLTSAFFTGKINACFYYKITDFT